jgi:prevent-host-death family protein
MIAMPNRANLKLDVDLQRGVVPISKAASSLAALIKRANSTGQPVIVTQKGYPTGVLLPIELFTALKDLAGDLDNLADTPDAQADGGPPAALSVAAPQPAAAPKAPRAAPRRRKPADAEADEQPA